MEKGESDKGQEVGVKDVSTLKPVKPNQTSGQNHRERKKHGRQKAPLYGKRLET